MAEIEESFVVTSLIDYSKNNTNGFPVSKYTGNESLVVTTSKNTVSLFKLRETKPFRSWSSKQNQQFTCPVIFNNATSHLHCVQNKQVLRQWTEDLDSIDSGSKVKFTDCIRQLLHLNNHEPIVIFENGDCVPLQFAIDSSELKRKNVLGNGENIINSKAVVGIDIITIFHHVASKKPTDVSFYCISLDINTGLVIDVVRTTFEKSHANFCDWDLVMFKETPFLYTLWDDGEIRKHNVTSLEIFSPLCRIKNNFNGNFLKIIDPTHALVVAPKSSGFQVEVWDLKFRVCKSSKNFDISLRSSSDLCWENGHLLIQSSNHIHCVTVKIYSSLLSSSIGNNASTDAVPVAKKIRWTSKNNENMDTLEILDKTNVLSVFVTCKEELAKIIENNDVQGLMTCLCLYKDILEPQLVDMLKFLLEVDEKFFDGVDVKISYPNQFYSESRTSCILKLMSQPFNDVFLYQYLKKISANDTLNLLKFLNFWVNENMLIYHPVDNVLTLQEAVTWINVLLDSHYNNFILMKDAEIQSFLLHLNEMVNNFFEIYEEIEDTTNLIESIRKGKKLPQTCKKSSYHMEILIL